MERLLSATQADRSMLGPVGDILEKDDSQTGECELFGIFGIFIQAFLAFICTSALIGKSRKHAPMITFANKVFHCYTVKKFLPGETRSWKVFCLDVWKQLLTAGFAHLLNLILAVYIQQLTGSGNGCVWYLITLLLDVILGMGVAFLLFKVIDEIAIKFGIEVSLQWLNSTQAFVN